MTFGLDLTTPTTISKTESNQRKNARAFNKDEQETDTKSVSLKQHQQ
jgi:hypothetical protein